jgi:2-succinyl-5-enolpyruvyl-6-hydroxy-3-cyclohexene-1-carboxylate synthase
MWNDYLGENFKVIVMNNNGGNIFKFIGDPQLMKSCERFFTTPHHVNIKSLVEAYGLKYIACHKDSEQVDALRELFTSDRATVLEIFTEAELNTQNYKGYFKNIKNS